MEIFRGLLGARRGMTARDYKWASAEYAVLTVILFATFGLTFGTLPVFFVGSMLVGGVLCLGECVCSVCLHAGLTLRKGDDR